MSFFVRPVPTLEVMNDAKLMADVLHGLVDVDYTLTVNVMKILSAPWLKSILVWVACKNFVFAFPSRTPVAQSDEQDSYVFL